MPVRIWFLKKYLRKTSCGLKFGHITRVAVICLRETKNLVPWQTAWWQSLRMFYTEIGTNRNTLITRPPLLNIIRWKPKTRWFTLGIPYKRVNNLQKNTMRAHSLFVVTLHKLLWRFLTGIWFDNITSF